MWRKTGILTALLTVSICAHQVMAFSFKGILEAWQTSDLHYAVPGNIAPGNNELELGGPKNLGEEYRISTPVITYAYASTFLDYFGAQGVKAVDAAFAFMNAVPAASKMSSDLSEFLTEGNLRINQRAQALGLVDMKSCMIQMLVEHMGLAGENHVFDLSYRKSQSGATACSFKYGVVVRNFDPITWEPSHYVNGRLYTYHIMELCPTNVADAVEDSVTSDSSGLFTAVATPDALSSGGYYLSLTRDDMGGLRYLYRKNNYNLEALPYGAVATSSASSSSSPWGIPVFTTSTATVTTNAPVLRGGVDKVSYVKMNFDSRLGTTFKAVTVSYTVPVLSGSKVINQQVTRTIKAPDILISASDFKVGYAYQDAAATTVTDSSGTHVSTGASSSVGGGLVAYRTVSYSSAVANVGQYNVGSIGGPGIINPQMQIIFNKVGPSYVNDNHYFFTEETSHTSYLLGVFDGSTNEPIVFPSGTSIRELEAQALRDPGQNQNIGGQ